MARFVLIGSTHGFASGKKGLGMAKNTESASKSEALEIIELTINNIDLLTRAFEVINEACEELQNPQLQLDTPPRVMIN